MILSSLSARLVFGATLLSALALQGDDWRVSWNQGVEDFQQHKYSSAFIFFEIVVNSSASPKDVKAEATFYSAVCAWNSERKEDAISRFLRSLEMGFDKLEEFDKGPDAVTMEPRIATALARARVERDRIEVERTTRIRKEFTEHYGPSQMAKLAAARQRLKSSKGKGPALSFSLPSVDGALMDAQRFRGRVVVLVVGGTWHWGSVTAALDLTDLARRHSGEPVSVLALFDEGQRQDPLTADAARSAVQTFATRFALPYPVAVADAKSLDSIGKLTGYPMLVIADSSGQVRLVEDGYRPLEYVDALVSDLLKEPVISKPTGK